jgi:MYXO-CTERM domain-containing protein
MSIGEKLLGAGALVMATVLRSDPLAGAAIGGGLIAGTGGPGVVVGAVVLVGVVALVLSRRRPGKGC